MKLKKIVTAHEDDRGKIIDILEGVEIDCATLITSKKGARRGDHYHKESIQYTFVLKGTMKLITQESGEKTETTLIEAGNLVFTPPMEKHALVALEDSEMLVLTQGPRGGQNYEEDTYRLTEKLK